MRIVDVPQNGKEWKDWRGKGLGASDAPTIMGVSPWTTPFQLWLEKTGICERPSFNEFAVAAMKRGHDLEPVARELFEMRMAARFPALSAEMDGHSYIRASLDGYNADSKALLEIKCPGKVDHAKAKSGKIPPKYFPQVQQQFLVTGAVKGYYVSFDGISDLAVIEVNPDIVYLPKLKTALCDFWTCVETRIPPESSKEDLESFIKRVVSDLNKLTSSVKALELLINK